MSVVVEQAIAVVEMDAEGDVISIAAKVLLAEVRQLRADNETLEFGVRRALAGVPEAKAMQNEHAAMRVQLDRIAAAMKSMDGSHTLPTPVGKAIVEISKALRGVP